MIFKIKLVEEITTIQTNPIFILKHIEDAFFKNAFFNFEQKLFILMNQNAKVVK